MEVKILVEETGRMGFNNKLMLDNFLHYLFRTDEKQENTGRLTELCVFSFRLGDEIRALPFGDLDVRMEFKDVAAEVINVYGLRSDNVVNEISYVSFLDVEDNDIRGVLNYEEIMELVNEVIVRKETVERYLFHVTHLDQGVWHIHSVLPRYHAESDSMEKIV